MTDIAERPVSEVSATRQPLMPRAAEPPAATRTPTSSLLGLSVRLFVAVLAVSVAVLAFSSIGQKLVVSRSGGWALALVGWFELVVAVLIVVRPRRSVITWALVGNALIASVWVWQQVAGHGATPTTVESLRFALEMTLVVVAAVLLIHPRIGVDWSSSTNVLLSILPVAVVVLTTEIGRASCWETV